MIGGRKRGLVLELDRGILWLTRHWLLVLNLSVGLFIGGTLLPPVLMELGLEGPARAGYTFYSFSCHQLPERSYYLFGPGTVNTYSLDKVLAEGANPNNLRRFVGNEQMGFKLGMAERNTAIYSTFLLAGLGFGLLRRRSRKVLRLSWPLFLLLILPMALDGGSHMFSEISGLGFRESNAWLATLTNNSLSTTFYSGTTLGSFNWLMRTITGTLFALACVWFAYPYLAQGFTDVAQQTQRQIVRATPPGSPIPRQEKTRA